MGGSASLRTFLNKPETPQDNEMKFSHVNFTPFRVILQTLAILIVPRCCHGNLLFTVCHVIFGTEKLRNLNNFQDNGLIKLKSGGEGIFRL